LNDYAVENLQKLTEAEEKLNSDPSKDEYFRSLVDTANEVASNL